jgi:membrane protein DedA with SNARE-associated domain
VEVVEAIVRLVVAWYGSNELLGMFVFIVLEEVGVPLIFPGDLLVVAAGVRDRSLWNALIVCTVASLATSVGSSILYAIVRRKGRPFLDRYGKYMHLNDDRIERLARWFRKHGALAIVIGRIVPGLRTPTTVMAGLFGVPYRTFAPATTVAGLIWALMYFYFGVLLEHAWEGVRDAVLAEPLQSALIAVAVAAAIVAGLGLARRWWIEENRPLGERAEA